MTNLEFLRKFTNKDKSMTYIILASENFVNKALYAQKTNNEWIFKMRFIGRMKWPQIITNKEMMKIKLLSK